jgi:hypothetical protein
MHRALLSLFGFCLTATVVLAAPPTTSADQPWQSVKGKGDPIVGASSDATSVSQTISAYIANADALKDFYTKNPNHAEAKEAKRLEAQAILYARSLGDKSQNGRAKQLVKDLRADVALDVDLREQLAAFSDNLDAEELNSTGDKRLAAYEETARALQAEFPGSVSIYESLNAIAVCSADDRAATIARDILAMPAPDQQKARAQLFLDRLELKGNSLVDLADAALGSGNAIHAAVGRPVVVYTWSSNAPQTIVLIKSLAPSLPADTAFVGVCLDLGDLQAAHQRAAADQPLGTQLYDGMGFMGKFAGRARLNAPGLIYIADRKGILVSVSAQRDPKALIQSVSNL